MLGFVFTYIRKVMLCYFNFSGVVSVKLLSVSIPSPVEIGESVKLKCAYDLEGSELYAIKWYKNKQEFYRYIPKESPPDKVFDTEGIDIDVSVTLFNYSNGYIAKSLLLATLKMVYSQRVLFHVKYPNYRGHTRDFFRSRFRKSMFPYFMYLASDFYVGYTSQIMFFLFISF